jgi:hypothetical protein
MSAALNPASEAPLHFEPRRANGMTPLMHAVCDDSVDVVQALLDSGADVNAKRSDGFTALALAAFFGRTRIVELLLERGADVRAVTRFGTSSEMWANARGFQEIVDLLQDVSETAVTSEEHSLVIPEEDVAVTPNENLAVESEEKSFRADPPLTVPKILPEIHDPPPLIAPAFHPGHAFLTRIGSDRRSLAALTVALIVTLGLAILATYQIRSLLKDDAKQTASTENTLRIEPQAAAAQPGEVQPARQESGSNQSGNNQEIGNKQTVAPDFPNKATSGPSEQSAPPATMVRPSIKTLSIPRHSGLTVRRTTVTQSEPPKQAAEPEIESKPAPLTVEVSRDRNTTPAPATRTADPPPPQAAPLGITSSKPRSKVIQWP